MTGGEENESKHRVTDETGLVAALGTLGFALAAVDRQLDEYYDSPDRQLHAGDLVCRLRIRGDRVVGAFKGPRRFRGDGSHSRIEVELPMDTPETARAALTGQGLVLTWRLEKRRRIYRHPGLPVEVCLDEIPALGLFVELEGPSPDITELRGRLGAAIGDAEPLNYYELALTRWESNGHQASDRLVFDE